MLLQYFGINLDQNQTRLALRTNTDDKNVFTSEIASYLKTTHNLESKLLINGNLDTIKLLIANHIPVIVEAWLRPHEDIGHVLILRGYDDTNQILIADDSYFGVGTKYPYSSFDQFQWQPFNRPYLPVFTPDQLSLAQSIIQDDWDYLTMHQHSAEYNQHLINQTPSNTYAWLNLGSSLYALGHHTAAQQAFETSKSLGWPPRLLWYRIEPIQNANQLGNHQQALELIRIGLTDYSAYPELHFQAAVAYLRLNQPNQARQSLTLALQADPNYQPALDLLAEL